MAVSSIAAALGTGSGIDTVSLVSSLVDAQFSIKNKQLQTQSDTLTAQISGVSSLKSAISGFSTALNNLVQGGTLATGPTSSLTTVAKVSTLTGKTVTNLAATLDVVQLAKPQTAASAPVTDRTAAIGGGSFTLTFGTATVADGTMTGFAPGSGTPVSITIADNSNLNAIAAAINAKNAGVTASIVSDTGGARLVLKGATGASQAFTLELSDPGLSDLSVGVGTTGTTIGSVAQDAIVKLDGVQVQRASNTISNLVDNVKIELSGVGTTTLGASTPTTAMSQAVSDFVETYNQVLTTLKQQVDPKTGALRNDPAAQALMRSLGRLPLTQISGDSTTPQTLAEIGVATNRDGSLRIDSARLTKALTTYPATIEKMFAPASGSATTGNGLAAALAAISTAAVSSQTGLGASEARYNTAKRDLSDAQDKTSEDADRVRARLTAQFAQMDARVAAYKSTQTFLTNQIAAWNKSG